MQNESPVPLVDRRTFIGAIILAGLAPHWQARSAAETLAETRARLAMCALDIADVYLRMADAPPPPLGVPCPRQPPFDPTLDPPF
ncbi:MAG TPA: hypothetical protein VH643_28985 [Gemmataceae bacterium]|jgi:hypothetical protein